jgi:hypothetical protein
VQPDLVLDVTLPLVSPPKRKTKGAPHTGADHVGLGEGVAPSSTVRIVLTISPGTANPCIRDILSRCSIESLYGMARIVKRQIVPEASAGRFLGTFLRVR